jgi:hypothetical protein
MALEARCFLPGNRTCMASYVSCVSTMIPNSSKNPQSQIQQPTSYHNSQVVQADQWKRHIAKPHFLHVFIKKNQMVIYRTFND